MLKHAKSHPKKRLDSLRSYSTLIRWFWQTGQSYRLQSLLNILLGGLMVVADLSFVWATKLAIDIATGADNRFTLSQAIALIICLIIVQMTLNISSRWVRAILGVRAQNDMQQRLFNRLLKAQWRPLRKVHTGHLINRLERDVTDVVRFVTENADSATVTRLTALLSSPWLYVGCIAAFALAAWLIYRFRNARPIAAVIRFCRGLWHGFAAIATMHGRLRWLILTVCIWGCYFMQLYVAFFAFPATAQVVAQDGVSAVMVCFVLSSISMIIPSNGGIGPWQLAIIFGLGIYATGIPQLTEAYATSFANLVMGAQTLLLILLGIFTFICIAIDRRRSRR